MHDAITIGVPVLAILFGILFNQRGLDRLETRIENVRAEIKEARAEAKADNLHLISRIDRMQADLSQFYQILGKHEGTIETMKRQA